MILQSAKSVTGFSPLQTLAGGACKYHVNAPVGDKFLISNSNNFQCARSPQTNLQSKCDCAVGAEHGMHASHAGRGLQATKKHGRVQSLKESQDRLTQGYSGISLRQRNEAIDAPTQEGGPG